LRVRDLRVLYNVEPDGSEVVRRHTSSFLALIRHMEKPPANPYASPIDGAAVAPRTTTFGELLPLWVWLAIAVPAAFFGSPADPIAMLLALAHGLLSFCFGTVIGSRSHILLRLLVLMLSSVMAFALAPLVVFSAGVCYGVFSVAAGVWAWRHIRHGRLRILVCFVVGFVIGSLIGPLGTSAGAVVGALLAKRSLGPRNALDVG
jgi:hypothetical protein